MILTYKNLVAVTLFLTPVNSLESFSGEFVNAEDLTSGDHEEFNPVIVENLRNPLNYFHETNMWADQDAQ